MLPIDQYDIPPAPAGDIITDLYNYVGQMLQAIYSYILDVIDDIISVAQTLLLQVKTLITNLVNEVIAAVKSIITSITAVVTQLIADVRAAFQSIADWIYKLVGPIITQIKDFAVSVYNTVSDLARGAISYLGSYVTASYNFIVQQLKDFIAPIVTWFDQVSTKVKEFVTQALVDIKAAYDEVVKQIKQSYQDLLGGSTSLINSIDNRLHGIGTAFNDAAQILLTGLRTVIQTGTSDWTEQAREIAKPFGLYMSQAEQTRLKTSVDSMFNYEGFQATSIDGARKSIQAMVPTTWLGQVVFGLFSALGLTMSLYRGMTDAQAQLVLQEFSTKFSYQLLSPADSAQATLRGAISRDKAIDNINRAGWSRENAELILDNSTTVPPVGELLSMLKRGLIKQEDYQEAIQRLGLPILYEGAYQQLSEIIPPVGDLITMAVKGAFSDEETALFRTKEDFPREIVAFGKQQGLTEEWLLKYWQSHWNLPSAGQGFEMFQRGIINREELDVLLKALDITPYWRDHMVQLNYNVLTRVDVRRMHQLGIMNRSELVKAHQDMGYSPADSEKLSDFVEDLNKGKPGEADEELGRLSRTNVINFYQDGTITAPRAIELLTKIGYTPDAATLFIETADFDAERVQRTAEIEYIIANVTAGVASFEQGQDELAKLHLSPTELSRATTKLLRESTKATKLPTVEQGTKMFQAGIIPEAQFSHLLTRLGYQAEWRQALIALAKFDSKPTVKKT